MRKKITMPPRHSHVPKCVPSARGKRFVGRPRPMVPKSAGRVIRANMARYESFPLDAILTVAQNGVNELRPFRHTGGSQRMATGLEHGVLCGLGRLGRKFGVHGSSN